MIRISISAVIDARSTQPPPHSAAAPPVFAGAAPLRPLQGPLAAALTVLVLVLILILSVFVAVAGGAARLPAGDTLRYLVAAIFGGSIPASELTGYTVIWEVRTPRVLLAAIVGAGLASIGVATQSMVRNSLADPFILGVSSGASSAPVPSSRSGCFPRSGSTHCPWLLFLVRSELPPLST